MQEVRPYTAAAGSPQRHILLRCNLRMPSKLLFHQVSTKVRSEGGQAGLEHFPVGEKEGEEELALTENVGHDHDAWILLLSLGIVHA